MRIEYIYNNIPLGRNYGIGLFEQKNDSISIRFLDSSTKSGLGERIAVPVKW
ncbi:hypothetical protein [Labilibaculum manganireducens]|uniref:hypothetical protein n=1 Tax=Labilibaculum manganireducens TaxID=1940525 RepID=UPI0015D5970B|nr:hypothetical protein [Labilibaculum manganireducens]